VLTVRFELGFYIPEDGIQNRKFSAVYAAQLSLQIMKMTLP
jgi:hypothetical protein